MSIDSPSLEAAREAAAGWFAQLNKHTVSLAELEAFQAWRREPRHDEAYRLIEAVWTQSGALATDPEILREVQTARARGAKARGRKGMAWVGAAALATSCAVGALVVVGGWGLGPTYETGVGQSRIVTLPDGGHVHLDTNTRIAVRYTGGQRRIDLLRGQALFEVKHDANRPMRVEAGGAVIDDLGTRFDVRRDPGAVRITVIEGAVRVSRTQDGFGPAASDWTLKPGQEVVVGAALRPPIPVDVARATAWTTGRLDFDGIPLNQATAEINRYAKTRVILDAGPISEIQISGAFDAVDTGAFVAAVSKLYDLRAVSRSDGAIVLSAEGRQSADR